MRIMISGGGTGGHTSPAVAIIEELRRRDAKLATQWVGCRDAIEERVCTSLSIPFRSVSVQGWPRKRMLRKGWAGAKLALAMLRCLGYIARFRPQMVVGVGGYVSVPLVLTAQRLGIPTAIHEQNAKLGLANRLLAQRARRVFLSYADTQGVYPRERAVVVGNPVRAGFTDPPDKGAACATFSLDPVIPVVLVVGGSQGARSINEAVKASIPNWQPGEVQFLWMTGTGYAAEARRVAERARVPVQVFAFIDEIVAACAAADLIVGRAGASSAAEMATLGKPSILVPYPLADNHQEENAKAFEQAGAAVILRDSDCTGERLLTEIRSLLHDTGRLATMGEAMSSFAKPDAAEAIVEELFMLVFGEPPSPTPP